MLSPLCLSKSAENSVAYLRCEIYVKYDKIKILRILEEIEKKREKT